MKKFAALFASVLLACALPSLAFAGSGNGDGSGGNSSEPLVVSSAKTANATIESGATINATDEITLTFSKNVCNESVREANKALIELVDSAGKAVDVEVILYDDQVDPDNKNNITIKPKDSYKAGTYTLTAKKGITSKSSVSTTEDYVLKFTVTDASSNVIPVVIGVTVVVVIAVVIALVVRSKKKKQQ